MSDLQDIPSAVSTLREAMKDDPEYAWGWHCNIAVPLMDTLGVSHKQANEAAAFLMWHLFDYDITAHSHYEYGKTPAQQYCETRIAAERAEDGRLA